MPLAKGSRVIMQVHYNLLAGPEPDVSAAQLRLAPATDDLGPLETVLLPAPVELPCRPGHDRRPALRPRRARSPTSKPASATRRADRELPPPAVRQGPAGPVQSCDQTMKQPATIRAVAGHMHLLGRSIKIEVNPGTPPRAHGAGHPGLGLRQPGRQAADRSPST